MNTSLTRTRRGGGMGKYWRFPKKSQSPSPPVVVAPITFSTLTVLELLKREILSRLRGCVWEGSCAVLSFGSSPGPRPGCGGLQPVPAPTLGLPQGAVREERASGTSQRIKGRAGAWRISQCKQGPLA